MALEVEGGVGADRGSHLSVTAKEKERDARVVCWINGLTGSHAREKRGGF